MCKISKLMNSLFSNDKVTTNTSAHGFILDWRGTGAARICIVADM